MQERMWRKGNPPTLLVGMLIRTTCCLDTLTFYKITTTIALAKTCLMLHYYHFFFFFLKFVIYCKTNPYIKCSRSIQDSAGRGEELSFWSQHLNITCLHFCLQPMWSFVICVGSTEPSLLANAIEVHSLNQFRFRNAFSSMCSSCWNMCIHLGESFILLLLECMFLDSLSRHNKDLEWQTLKPPQCVAALNSGLG